MKTVSASYTILKSFEVPDSISDEEIEDLVAEMAPDDVNDIEWVLY